MTFYTWLLLAVVPIAKRLLMSLGIAILVYEGLDAILFYVQNNITSLMSQTPADIYQLASLMGIPQSIGIYLGAITTKISITTTKRFGLI